jgi:hypothetical protein
MPRMKKIRTINHAPLRKPGPKPVTSSHIEAHEYDHAKKLLTVTFKGGRKYRYHDVDASTAKGLAKAPSKGSFMHASVIGKFRHDKI